MELSFKQKENVIQGETDLSSRLLFKVSHKKSCLKCVEITNLQILRNLYFDFFQRTKLRQPTGQRQLLENKQRLCNIWKFGNSTPMKYLFL